MAGLIACTATSGLCPATSTKFACTYGASAFTWYSTKSTDRHGGRPYFSTRRLFSTEKTPDTPLARTFAVSLSACVDTTPSRVTLPVSTMM